MAVSLASITNRGNMRGLRFVTAVCSSTENYATGGITISPNTIGLNTISSAFVVAGPLAGGSYVATFNSSTNKIGLAWVDTTVDGAALPEIPNATAIGATVYTIFAFGT